jgi:SAM-dependent methyltransferase
MKYLNYFFYLATNWSFRIAWHITLHEIKGEKKYNINTTGKDDLAALEDKGIDTEHATIYMPVSYDLLEELFTYLSPKKLTHFLDIGCGKGRAMCVAAHYGFTTITGVDFSKELCLEAEKNLTKIKEQKPELTYKIYTNDAFYFEIPTSVDCIFLFNPFDEIIMSGVVENIMISLEENPRDLVIIYANPLHKELFLAEGFVEINHTKKLKYLEASILELPNKGTKNSTK